MRGAKACKCRDEGHAARIRDGLSKGAEGGGVRHSQKPGHKGYGLGRDGDVAFKRIGGDAAVGPGDGAREAVARRGARRCQGHQAGAGAVGGLYCAGRADALAVKRGMAVAPAAEVPRRLSEDRGVGRQSTGAPKIAPRWGETLMLRVARIKNREVLFAFL
jgi:hypothetical protein